MRPGLLAGERHAPHLQAPIGFAQGLADPFKEFLMPAGAVDQAAELPDLGKIDGHDRLARGHVFVGLDRIRSEEHTSELQSLLRISYAVFCLKQKTTIIITKLVYCF